MQANVSAQECNDRSEAARQNQYCRYTVYCTYIIQVGQYLSVLHNTIIII